MPRQERDVFNTLSQRRNRQHESLKPVRKIGSKAPAVHELHEISMRCHHDAEITPLVSLGAKRGDDLEARWRAAA